MPFLGTHLPPAVANVRVGRHSFSLHRPSQSSVFVGANGVPRDSVIDPGPGLYWFLIDDHDPRLSIRVIDVLDVGDDTGSPPMFIDRVSGRTGSDPLLVAVLSAELGVQGPVFGQ
nr:hypothetical protein